MTSRIEQQLAEKLARLRALRESAVTYQQIIDTNVAILEELARAREAVRELIELRRKGAKTLRAFIRLGPGLFSVAEIEIPDKLFVNVGANVIVAMPLESVLSTIAAQEEAVRRETARAQQLLLGITRMIEQLQDEIAKLQASLAAQRKS